MAESSKWKWVALVPLALVAFIVSTLAVYRPDREIRHIEPGTSDGPAFAVQIVRPRSGLPIGGLLPPRWFGLDGTLGFDSESAGAEVVSVAAERLEFAADGWRVVIARTADGRAGASSEATFEMQFEERPRIVTGRPSEEPIGRCTLERMGDTGEVHGRFEIELPRCEDAATGAPLGWPPQPLVLRGSFDRLPLD